MYRLLLCANIGLGIAASVVHYNTKVAASHASAVVSVAPSPTRIDVRRPVMASSISHRAPRVSGDTVLVVSLGYTATR